MDLQRALAPGGPALEVELVKVTYVVRVEVREKHVVDALRGDAPQAEIFR